MKKSIRLAIAGGLSIAAVTIGLTSAAASGVRPGGPAVPNANNVSNNLQPNLTPSVLRPPHNESTFVSITPCRIADTRVAVGAIGNGATRSYYVGGTTGFAPQGGKSGGCGIPAGATAVAASVTAITPSGGGYLRAYPSNQAEPTATTLTYPAHVSSGTGATLSLNTGSAIALKVTNHAATINLVIDISGYYIAPIEGMVYGTGASIYAGSSRLVSAVRNGTGDYSVTIDTDVAYCTTTTTGYSGFVYTSSYAFNGNQVRVHMWTLNSSTHVETPYDGYFYLQVTC